MSSDIKQSLGSTKWSKFTRSYNKILLLGQGLLQIIIQWFVPCLYDIGMMFGRHMDIVWMTSTVFCTETDYEGMCAQHKKIYNIFRNREIRACAGDRSRTEKFGC